jgi:DNA helicase-2/ATP-dependent DNA helicase PcrA
MKLTKLNAQQRLCASSIVSSDILVSAGAGSGKTAVISYTIANLIANQRVDPSSVLLLTFANRAAAEMLERSIRLLGTRPKSVPTGGTFHSFAVHALRIYAKALGFPRSFSIGTSDDAKDLVVDALTSYPDASHVNPYVWMRERSWAVSRGLKQSEWLSKKCLINSGVSKKVVLHVQKLKRKIGFMDFDDLLVLWNRLMVKRPDLLQGLQKRYRWIFIDEYQDTSHSQEAMILKLKGPHNRLMIVGDLLQALYSWRGADPDNIKRALEHWPSMKLLKLEQNYRSTPQILSLANSIADQRDPDPFSKTLFSKMGNGPVPTFRVMENTQEEARWVANKIRDLRSAGAVKSNKIAVLYRLNRIPFDLEIILNKFGVPYIKYGGLDVLGARHIKDVISILRTVVNPRDSVAAKRVLILCAGVGLKGAGDLWENGAGKLVDRIPSQTKFSELLSLKKLLSSLGPKSKPTAVLPKVLDWYRASQAGLKLEENRLEDLVYLQDAANSFASIRQMVDSLTLDASQNKKRNKQRKEDCIVLSTFHSSKGLEWDHVFLLGFTDNVIPGKKVGPDLEEELRAAYVAVTRAAKKLTITMGFRSKGGEVQQPCRFLSDPDTADLVDWQGIPLKQEPLAEWDDGDDDEGFVDY